MTMQGVAVALSVFGYVMAGVAMLAILGLVFEDKIRSVLHSKNKEDSNDTTAQK